MKNAIVLLLFLLVAEYSYAQNGVSEKSSSHNLTVVSNYFEFLFKRGDFVSLEKLILKEAVYLQAEGLPYGGTYKGFKEWMEMFKKVPMYFDLQLVGNPILHSDSQNKSVAASFTIKFKSKKSGKEFTMPIMELFELKDGKIMRVQPFYFDTKKINDLM
ncbi:MAG: nuclear transport factor 2 family protein [Cyclobacteriaceae bacterium]